MILSESPPRIEGTGITVIDVYDAYTRQRYEPAEIADAYRISLGDVHEALGHFYHNAEDLRDYDPNEVFSVEQALDER